MLRAQQMSTDSLLPQIDREKLPKHIAIIMDGNGRWAKKRALPRLVGHEYGVKSVRTVAETAARLGVKYLTLYTFSTENWNRPQLEVKAIMALLVRTIRKEVATLQKNNIRLRTIGNIEALPKDAYNELQEAMALTANNDSMDLPELDLLIRTSGEFRISNFMLWEMAYGEFYFTDIYWPEFDQEAFYRAIVDYQKRERRFGKTSDQIKP